MPVVIHTSEFERIKASIEEPAQTDKEAKRIRLKQISNNRTDKWPNTLEAMRRKKENWKKEKEDREELKRREIDDIELQLQRETRLKQIERANRLLFEQTDKMKTLRSQQLLADVVHDRQNQIEEKNILLNNQRVKEKRWEKTLIQQMKESDKKEALALKKRQENNRKSAKIQKEQLLEFKNSFIEQLREEKREGEKIKQKAAQDILEEEQIEAARKRRARQANEDTRIANEQLKLLREQEKKKQEVEDKLREDAEKKKLKIVEKREELQRLKHEKKQASKQRMIDLATENLLKFEQKNEHRLECQKKEVKEKEDNELAERAQRRLKQKILIDRSRNNQIAMKDAAAKAEEDEAKRAIREWKRSQEFLEKQEKECENEKRRELLELSTYQRRQAAARKTFHMEERAAKLLSEQESKQKVAKEDELYEKYAANVFEESKEIGIKNTYPLQKAMKATSIDLLPASGFRV